ncbi:transposase [Amycolatopsis sp. DSM 110486]|uniref:transposase n=1 Tax=Amycolatopsis sp. DSM 110486 TaxID=2865832 RepID=UPI001C69BF04|nr:transposase [Amycolatopsis sp. DSM 110486]QYN18868.1 transposase [Amycolatopsis sp. DSM 110486]
MIEDLVPVLTGNADARSPRRRAMVKGVICRYQRGIAWRDVPAVFGPLQTVLAWHRRMAGDGTWNTVLQRSRSRPFPWRVEYHGCASSSKGTADRWWRWSDPGQGGDRPMFPHLMRHLWIRRPGPGRARTRSDRVRGDKAYSSRAIREHLRARGVTAVIPEPADQLGIVHRSAVVLHAFITWTKALSDPA